MPQSYPVGQAPWETQNNVPDSFPVGQAPWEIQETKFEPEEQPGIFKSIVQGVAKPFLQTGITAEKALKGLGAIATRNVEALKNAASQEPVNFGYFGKVAPLQNIKQAVGTGAQIGATLAGGLASAPKTALGRIGAGSAVGGLFGGGQAAEENKSVGEIAKQTAIGSIFGAGTSAGIELGKYLVKGIPKLLSYTSNTPEEVLQRQYDNPKVMAQTLKEVKKEGPLGVLDEIQNGAKDLRKKLTTQWQEGAAAVIEQNTGGRAGFTVQEVSKLEKVADDFGIDLPQNTSNFSVKELLDLNKEINELYSKRAVRESAQGILVRKSKELVGTKLDKFIGAKELLNNYASEKQVLDAISDIVKPYNKSPITQSTALSRVKSIFNDNKPAFLSAVKDLEQVTGLPFSDKAATLNILQKAPIAGNKIITQLIELFLFPLTSPRFAGLESRLAGRASQFGTNIAQRLGTQGPGFVKTGLSESARRLFNSSNQ